MKKIFHKIILGIFLLASLAFVPASAHAQVSAAGTDFGGMVLTSFPCTCSAGTWWLLVYDYKTKTPLPLTRELTSRTNLYGMIFTGYPILGTYTQGGNCQIYAGTSCVTVPSIGMLSPYPLPGYGTSLIPGF